MTNEEFSNEFDILYNNITSNQAPGLDEYEKSVLLTKAQDQIVKDYFDPRTNKVQAGFDDSLRRQVDFSMILKNTSYQKSQEFVYSPSLFPNSSLPGCRSYDEVLKALGRGKITQGDINYIKGSLAYVASVEETTPEHTEDGIQAFRYFVLHPFAEGSFDGRKNTKSVLLSEPILMFINESVTVVRDGEQTNLVVIPISYSGYTSHMSKPFKRPAKSQAWRLLDSSNGAKKAEIIVGPQDEIVKYSFRYIRKPRPIILGNLDGLTIEGETGEDQTPSTTSCELDPILHQEILQRAVELAKAAYQGDLQSQLTLGQLSQTEIGQVVQSR